MSELTEKGHAGGFIISEANGWRSRAVVTIAAGQNLNAGAVLGRLSGDGTYAVYDNDASDGTQAAAAILLDDCDASDEAKEATVIIRDAEVNGEELVWQSADEVTAGVADLLALGIVVM